MSLPPRDTFGRQWLLCGLLAAAALFGWRSASGRLGPTQAPRTHPQGSVDWFLVVRMPAITTQYEAGVEVMKVRYDEWLEALRRAGFRPIRLSEALSSIAAGKALPERSVVAVFEPGLRRTQRIVDPIFRRRGWQGVWLTDLAAMRGGSREFITFRDARLMSSSGWWDVGFSRKDGGYDVRSREGVFTLGDGGRVWSGVEGTFALNRGAAKRGLSVLTVNSDWLASELVDRLRAELPYVRRTCLAKAVIQGRAWGVPGPRASSPTECAPFDLEAPPHKRDNRLHWLGTAGLRNLRLALEVGSVVGELRLHLLRDDVAGSRLTIVFGEKVLYVDEWHGTDKRRLLETPLAARRGPISATITLEGERVSLQTNGGPAWVSPPLALSERGALVLQVAERIRGVARAEGVRLTLEPQAPAAIAASLP